MEKQDFIKTFKRIYPEDFIRVLRVNIIDENTAILGTAFPDGLFFFVVGNGSVSSSYNSEDEAMRYIR